MALDRKARQKTRREILIGLDAANDKSLPRKQRSEARKSVVINMELLGILVGAATTPVSTPLYDKFIGGSFKIDPSTIVSSLEKIHGELIKAGDDEQSATEKLKEPLIKAITATVNPDELIQDVFDKALDENAMDENASELEDDQEPEVIEEAIMFPIPRKDALQEKGIYFLNGKIDDNSVNPLIQTILELNAKPVDERPKNVKLVVSSNGGDVESAFGLIDVMNISKIPVHTVAMSRVKSCGLLVTMNGAKGHRSIMKNTSVLSHQFSWATGGTQAAMEAANERVTQLKGSMCGYYQKMTGLDEKTVKKELLGPTDRWLTAEQAIKLGLVDKIEDGSFLKVA
jgi:ATP-dependent Clp protease, protease subunit